MTICSKCGRTIERRKICEVTRIGGGSRYIRSERVYRCDRCELSHIDGESERTILRKALSHAMNALIDGGVSKTEALNHASKALWASDDIEAAENIKYV